MSALSLIPLPFESGIFGRPVLALKIPAPSAPDARQQFSVLRDRCAQAHAALVVCRIAEHDRAAASLLEGAGFRRIERLFTLARPLEIDRRKAGQEADIFSATPADHEACVAIGGTAFSFDRFHADPHLSNAVSGRIKKAWVRNALAGRADLGLVARQADAAVGFIFCRVTPSGPVIDLMAVANDHRRRGHGRRLVEAALTYYAGRFSRMTVATQERNAPSLALYRSLGFEIVETQLTYHWTPNPRQS